MIRKIILAVLLFGLLACSQDQGQAAQPTSPSEKQGQTAAESVHKPAHMLVFFINPDGGPCQMQGRILSDMESELKDKVFIRPVSTTVKEDMNIFYAYGIRALPTILLADLKGKEISRLPPGVHNAETIRKLVNRIPEN